MRLRIGVGKSENLGVAEYVLQNFKPNERELLASKEPEVFEQIVTFITPNFT